MVISSTKQKKKQQKKHILPRFSEAQPCCGHTESEDDASDLNMAWLGGEGWEIIEGRVGGAHGL